MFDGVDGSGRTRGCRCTRGSHGSRSSLVEAVDSAVDWAAGLFLTLTVCVQLLDLLIETVVFAS